MHDAQHMWLIGSLLLVLLCSCDEQRGAAPAIARGQAMAYADHLVDHRRLEWGPIIQVWEPAPMPGLRGVWWQIDYRPGETVRSVLVDAESGWARLPPDDAPLRRRAAGLSPVPGNWILLLEEPQVDDGEGPTRVAALNDLLSEDLEPLVSLRQLPDGRTQAVYGWREGRGMVRDARIAERIQRRLGRAVQWRNLSE